MADLPFSAPTVLRNIDASLPTGADHAPQLKSPYDAIAVFVHACMLSVGFRLIGLSDDDRLETPIEGASPQPLPPAWNAAPSTYAFRYAHAQSSLQYLLKINRLGARTVIMAVGLGDDKTVSFDVVTRDFLSESFFPYTLPATAQPEQGQEQEQEQGPLENGFISASRISDLSALIKINIVQKLIPGLSKPGYTEESTSTTSTSTSSRHPPPQPRHQPYEPFLPHNPAPLGRYPPPPRPLPAGADRPPGFDDEYDILRPPGGGYGYGGRYGGLHGTGGRNPLAIGEDDLNPPGLNPFAPMGGMHPTGEHPMFGGGGPRGDGGGVRDPRFPGGARYDPVGPGDEMGGLRGPRGPGMGGPGGWGGGFGGYGGGDFI